MASGPPVDVHARPFLVQKLFLVAIQCFFSGLMQPSYGKHAGKVSHRWRQLRHAHRSWARLCLVLAAAAVGGYAPAVTEAQAAAISRGAALVGAATRLTVVPDAGLVDGQQVTVSVASGSYGTTYAVAVCDPAAYAVLAQPSASLQDACDGRHNTIMTVGTAGAARSSIDVPAVLTTALGAADCRKVQCFVAIAALHSTGGASILVQDLSFATKACAAPGSCATPADAWDPSLGPTSTVPSPVPPSTTAPASTTAPSSTTAVPVGPTGTVPASAPRLASWPRRPGPGRDGPPHDRGQPDRPWLRLGAVQRPAPAGRRLHQSRHR